MAYQRIVELVTRLAKLTGNSKVQWEETTQSNAYQVALPGYTVIVSEKPAYENDAFDYVLAIHNADGNLVDSVTDGDLHDHVEGGARGAYQVMQGIFQGARRKAMGVDAALDAILNELPDDDEIPF